MLQQVASGGESAGWTEEVEAGGPVMCDTSSKTIYSNSGINNGLYIAVSRFCVLECIIVMSGSWYNNDRDQPPLSQLSE